jgi:hypothetical protein
VRCYAKEGGILEKIRDAEKRGRFRKGEGEKFLESPAVQEELAVVLAPLKVQADFEARLRAEVAKVTADLEKDKETLRKELNEVKRLGGGPIDPDQLEDRLTRLTNLDPEKHGSLVLDAIQTGFVVRGLMEGRMRRVAPQKKAEDEPNVEGIYHGLFTKMLTAPPVTIEGQPSAPPSLPLEPSDLYPPAPPQMPLEEPAAEPAAVSPPPAPPRGQKAGTAKAVPLVIEVE